MKRILYEEDTSCVDKKDIKLSMQLTSSLPSFSSSTDGVTAHKFTLPPGSIYIMKGRSRYEYFHDATRKSGSNPFALVLRYGKFNPP